MNTMKFDRNKDSLNTDPIIYMNSMDTKILGTLWTHCTRKSTFMSSLINMSTSI